MKQVDDTLARGKLFVMQDMFCGGDLYISRD